MTEVVTNCENIDKTENINTKNYIPCKDSINNISNTELHDELLELSELGKDEVNVFMESIENRGRYDVMLETVRLTINHELNLQKLVENLKIDEKKFLHQQLKSYLAGIQL